VSYELIIRDRAQVEIAEIMRWYEAKEAGLGRYFLRCLDATFEALSHYPTAPRIIRHAYRRVPVRRFPVSVYYIVSDAKIYIDVIEPMMRDPSTLEEKLKRRESL